MRSAPPRWPSVSKSQLRDLGIDVSLRQVEQITPVVNSRDYQAAMYRGGTAPTADPGFVLNTVFASWGPDNGQLGYSSARVDALVTQLNGTVDPAERARLGLQAQGVLRDEAPAVFLLSPRLHIAVYPRVRNVEYHPFDAYLVTN